VVLKEVGAERVLPIYIGPGEASAIAMHLGGMAFARPLTHDLLVSVLGELGGTLRRVLITSVEESTYFAQLIIDRDGEVLSVDARPSDSIAVALRLDAKIYADEALLEAPNVIEVTETPTFLGVDAPVCGDPDLNTDEVDGSHGVEETLEERLRSMRPEDLGRFQS